VAARPAPVPATAAPIKVGALLFEGFELLDVFGPLEMFGMLKERASITVLAENAGSVRSFQGPSCIAECALAGDHGLDVLLIPGGMGTRREVANEPFLAQLRRQCEKARYVATVCTGSGLLARTGALDGRRATSNKFAFKWAASQGPNVTWVPSARWVEDGKFFTSSGVSAGMDMSLGLIGHLFGRETSVTIANWAEYEWHEDKDWDPFAALNGLA
jgi:transcriptional regulator GlxA family with amidase domain